MEKTLCYKKLIDFFYPTQRRKNKTEKKLIVSYFNKAKNVSLNIFYIVILLQKKSTTILFIRGLKEEY